MHPTPLSGWVYHPNELGLEHSLQSGERVGSWSLTNIPQLPRTPSRNCLKRGWSRTPCADLAGVPGPKGANGGLLGPYEATFSAPPGLFRQFQDESSRKMG